MRHLKLHTVNDIYEDKLKKSFELVWENASCYD